MRCRPLPETGFYQGRDVLITGGAGCIGSNLADALVQLGARVRILDDLSASSRSNIAHLEGQLTFVEGDINDVPRLTGLLDGCDTVFHLAALFANQNSVDHPDKDLMVNGMGTWRVLEGAARTGARRVVYASSGCSVYGAHPRLPATESQLSLELDTPYQATKLLGEAYCRVVHNLYGLDCVRVRLFNVYGPGELPGRYRNVIPNFVTRALAGKPLPITGTGRETRDFTFVEDAVTGLLLAGQSPNAKGEGINIASGSETSIATVVKWINRYTRNRAGTRWSRRRGWDRIERRRADIRKAGELLGYQPMVPFTVGLRATVDWLRQRL